MSSIRIVKCSSFNFVPIFVISVFLTCFPPFSKTKVIFISSKSSKTLVIISVLGIVNPPPGLLAKGRP